MPADKRHLTRLALFAGAVVLTVLLFIAPRTKAVSQGQKAEELPVNDDASGMEVFRSMALRQLAGADVRKFERLKHNHQFDSLQQFWLRLKQPDLIALTAEEKARETKLAADYLEAGSRYYNAVRFASDNARIPALYQGAIRNFRRVLEKEPGHTEAKIMLASCYVEGSEDPMKGIALLREVEKTDSANVRLQLSFAFFSMKSGQLDKAIGRFEKVLAIDSTYLEAWLHLADAYEQLGEFETTASMLKQYARRTDDVTARLEVNKYIDQLNRKHNN